MNRLDSYSSHGMNPSNSISNFDILLERPLPASSSSLSPPLVVPPDLPSVQNSNSSTYFNQIQSWQDAEIASWLLSSKLSASLVEIFKVNDITGKILLDVDLIALKEMGIKSVGERIKVLVQIKALRKKCSISQQNSSSNGRRESASSASSVTGGGTPIVPIKSTRIAGKIPPPLHLSQSNNNHSSSSSYSSSSLPQIYQSTTPTHSNTRSNSSGNFMTSPRSATLRSIPPPTQPPPKSQPPPPPPSSMSSSGSRPSLSTSNSYGSHNKNPSFTTTSPTTSSNTWNGEYGLPKAPSSFKSSNNSGSISKPPMGVLPLRPSTGTEANINGSLQQQHRKSGSVGNTFLNKSTGSTPHPYAAVPSPTFSNTSPNKGLLPSPSLLPSSNSFNSVGSNGSSLELVMKKAMKFMTEDGISKMIVVQDCTEGKEILERVLKKFGKTFISPTSSSNGSVDEFGGLGEWGIFRLSEEGASPIRMLSHIELLAICQDGQAIERSKGLILKRISTFPSSNSTTETNSMVKKRGRKLQWMFGEENAPETNLPGGVSISSSNSMKSGLNNYGNIPSTIIEPPSPLFELSSGDIQVRVEEEPDEMERVNFARIKLNDLSSNNQGGGEGINLNPFDRPKRASTISVLSGLGGGITDWSTQLNTSPSSSHSLIPPASSHSPSSSNSPSSPSPAYLTSGKKLRNFFGQRPPSELISNHLTEYFPKAEKKLMSKSVRQSLRKSVVRRDSQYNLIANGGGTSWEAGGSNFGGRETTGGGSWSNSSRFSNASSINSSPLPLIPSNELLSTTNSNYANNQSLTPPRISSIPKTKTSLEITDESTEEEDQTDGDNETDDQDSFVSHGSRSTESFPPNNSNFNSNFDPRRSSRISIYSKSSHKGNGGGGWDKRSVHSDAASILTVDEVTAELEIRRVSIATNGSLYNYSMEDEEEKSGGGNSNGFLRPPSVRSLEESVQEVEEDQEEDDDAEYESSSDESIEPEQEILPISNKSTTKWIKGALIGAGSFGSVYLGMNPMNGSLMAVKQVELSTSGNSHNEERKKLMLDALEREIELLKVLEHENIVQYLDSSSSPTHLNIFLEYVPGGSVAALLLNYGAFEEALVSKFVKQILTGLDYLHGKEIIHRDIKGANILVDNKGGIKISDFGISKKVEDNLLVGGHRPSLQGSVYWMAPEVVKQTAYTAKADIWSLGCLVVEMLTGTHPWANLTQMQAIFRIGSASAPTIPDDISISAEEFLEKTFEIDFNLRPSAIELLHTNFIKLEGQELVQEDGMSGNNNLSQATPTRATFLG